MDNRPLVCTLLVALSILAVVEAVEGVETVRVDASTGAPRLLVDGVPVRARFFFGAQRAGPLTIGPDAQQITFEFSPVEDELDHATMHLRFGQLAGDVFLDDIRVVDLDTRTDTVPSCRFESGMDSFDRDWTAWPQGTANTVGTLRVEDGVGHDGSAALHLKLTAPPTGHWPDFHFYHHANLALHANHRYRVSLWVRAVPARTLTVAFYRPGQQFTFLGGPPGPFAQQIKLAAEAGVNLVSFPVPTPWPRPDEPTDWSAVDRICQAVLEANPDALLLPRIGMGAPGWWREAHPDDVMVWDTGGQEHIDTVVASPRYRRAAAERLTALVEHTEKAFGAHVAGYHPCGQNTGEWFYQETWKSALNGYAPASVRAWREWLQSRYDTDAALQTAWHDAHVTLHQAKVPTPESRRAAPAGTLRDPVAERALIDFAEFQQQMMADCVCQLARAVRQATHGRKLVVFFYGYVFEFGAIRNGPATAGHYALRRVLQCSDIDVLCSPISYFDRGLGQSAPAMTAAESVALAGKMWLDEDDTRTYLATGKFPGWQAGVDTLDETKAILIRNTAQCAMRNFGTWWMDLGATGWFNDRRLWDQMAQLRALDEPLLRHPCPYRPEVAAVIHERSMLRVAAGGHVLTRPAVYEARRPLGRMGAPYGQYLLDDVIAGRVSAKMFVFLTAWCLSPKERRNLLKATDGALRIWCYAPGYQEPDRTSVSGMRELTGFALEEVSPPKAWAEPTAAGRRLGLTKRFGPDGPIRPLLAAVDAKPEEILAVYSDGSAAVALRQSDQGSSLFVGPPGLTTELLRLAARRARVHLFAEHDCNIYANGPYLALHASQSGPLEIDTGCSGPIRDVMSGHIVSTGPKLMLKLKTGETRVFAAESDERAQRSRSRD